MLCYYRINRSNTKGYMAFTVFELRSIVEAHGAVPQYVGEKDAEITDFTNALQVLNSLLNMRFDNREVMEAILRDVFIKLGREPDIEEANPEEVLLYSQLMVRVGDFMIADPDLVRAQRLLDRDKVQSSD